MYFEKVKKKKNRNGRRDEAQKYLFLNYMFL